MKKNLKIIRFTLFISLFVISNTYGQADTVKKFMTPPQPVQYNAGFDVIIKTNGEIVYGLVKSGASSVGLGVMARVGAAYYLSDLLQLFLDAGVGTSVINLGLAVSLK